MAENWKSKDGEKQERVTWFRVSAFGKLAEICAQYLVKGSPVLIEGKITTNKYTDKNGVEKESWDVRADTMQMLGGKKDGEQSSGNSASKPAQNQSRSSQGAGPVNAFDDMTDDIPFNRISNKLALSL